MDVNIISIHFLPVMQALQKTFLLLFLSQVILSCKKEELDIEILSSEEKYEIVIEGFISTEPDRYRVKLTKPISKNNNSTIHIEDAKVELRDGQNVYSYHKSSIPGIYISNDTIVGEIGKRYTLIVNYNNKIFKGSDSLIQCDNTFDFIAKESQYDESNISIEIPHHNFGFETTSTWGVIEPISSQINFPFYSLQDVYINNIFNHKGSLPQGVFSDGSYYTHINGSLTDTLEILMTSGFVPESK